MQQYGNPVYAADWDPSSPPCTGGEVVASPNELSATTRYPEGFIAAAVDLVETPLCMQPMFDGTYMSGEAGEYSKHEALTTTARGQISQFVFSFNSRRIGNNIDSRSSTGLTAPPPVVSTVERPAEVNMSPNPPAPTLLTPLANLPAYPAQAQKKPSQPKADNTVLPGIYVFSQWEPKGSPEASSSSNGAVSSASRQISPSSSRGGSSGGGSASSSQYTGRGDTYVFCSSRREIHLTLSRYRMSPPTSPSPSDDTRSGVTPIDYHCPEEGCKGHGHARHLIAHMKEKHDLDVPTSVNPGPTRCLCEHKFKQLEPYTDARAFLRHVCGVHMGLKDVCVDCGRDYSRPDALKRHQTTKKHLKNVEEFSGGFARESAEAEVVAVAEAEGSKRKRGSADEAQAGEGKKKRPAY